MMYSSSCTAPNFERSDALKLDVSLSNSVDALSGELLAIPLHKPNSTSGTRLEELILSLPTGLPASIQTIVHEILRDSHFKGEAATTHTVRLLSSPHSLPVKHVTLIGLGPRPSPAAASSASAESKSFSLASQIGKTIASVAKEVKAASVSLFAPGTTPAASSSTEISQSSHAIAQLLQAISDASYSDLRFKKKEEEDSAAVRPLALQLLGFSLPGTGTSSFSETYRVSQAVADGVHFAKDLVGAPANVKTPIVVADQARKIAADHGLQCEVLGEEECRARGMGGYLGVGQGILILILRH